MKKFLSTLLVAVFAIGTLCAFTACDLGGSDPTWGEQYSVQAAYSLAVEKGYEGTLEEFIASISGKDGVGIKEVVLNAEGELVVTLTDNTEKNLGKVVDKSYSAHTHAGVLCAATIPGCTQSGIAEHWECSICGKYFKDEDCTEELVSIKDIASLVTPASGHHWSGWTESAGNHSRKCLVCGETEAGAHSYNDKNWCTACLLTKDATDGLVFKPTFINGVYGFAVDGDKGWGEPEHHFESLVIPYYFDGKPVLMISYGAFNSFVDIESVIIPDSVVRIEAFAFSGCDDLKNITIPKSVKYFGMELFTREALTDIYYGGTKEEWNAIKKDQYWDGSMSKYTVHCSDGDIENA